MKAIQVKFLPPTNHKPARWKAIAEGVPHITVGTYSATAKEAALLLCDKHGWGTDLIHGVLPNGDHVFVFRAAEDAALWRASNSLVEAYRDRGYGVGEEVDAVEESLSAAIRAGRGKEVSQ